MGFCDDVKISDGNPHRNNIAISDNLQGLQQILHNFHELDNQMDLDRKSQDSPTCWMTVMTTNDNDDGSNSADNIGSDNYFVDDGDS